MKFTDHQPTTRIFISATSGDLATVREIVKQGLLTMHCLPVEQTNFAPDYRTVSEMLEERIRECDAVIHLVGLRYGAAPDPATLAPGAPRRSFTQMEADIARRLGLKLYVFLCPENFLYDACAPEPPELAALQTAYRAEIGDRATLHTHVGDRNDVAQRIRELQLDLEKVRAHLMQQRRRVFVGAAIAVLLIAGLAGAVWWNVRRTPELIAARVQEAAAYDPVRIRAKLEQEIQERAQAAIAKLDPVHDWEKIGRLESARDQQLADVDRILEQMGQAFDKKEASPNFVIASQLLSENGVPEALRFLQSKSTTREAKIQVLMKARAAQEEALRELLREKLLTASLLEKDGRYDEAEAEYRAVVQEGGPWPEPRYHLALLLMHRGRSVDPAEGNRKLQEAVELSRGTLAFAGNLRATDPDAWAGAQGSLASALREQGTRAAGDEGRQLLEQSAAAYRAALEVRTREQFPDMWAHTQNNLGLSLRELAQRMKGEESLRTLEQAAAACRASLEVRTREKHPKDWAATQNSLANILTAQSGRTTGEESQRQLGEAVLAYRAALDARGNGSKEGYATIQNNLGTALLGQAKRVKGEERSRLADESIVAFRAALEFRKREKRPQEWAQTQNNLGGALREQSLHTPGAEGTRLLTEAVAIYRAALEVRTKVLLPQDWARTSRNLIVALHDLAKRTPGPDGEKLKAEADQLDRDTPDR